MAVERINISFYLLKTTQVPKFRQELLDILDDALPLTAGLEGSFYPLQTINKPPGWAAGIRTVLENPNNLAITAQSAGGLLVLNHRGRTLVGSFGHAWFRLKSDWLVHDFGRIVALNGIPKDKLLEINAEQVFAKWHLSRERSPRATTLNEFGVESERDLVSAIEGIPRDSILGPVIRGATSLRLTITLSDLRAVLEKIDVLYRSKAYIKEWPELGNILPVRDSELIEQLDSSLDDDLGAGRAQKSLVLFAPSMRESGPPLNSYVMGRLTKDCATSPYLTYSLWETSLKKTGRTPGVGLSKATAVHCLDDSHQELGKVTVYDCFGYETSLKGKQYVLSAGIWYEAGNDFVNAINRTLTLLPAPRFALPAWDRVISEGEYNRMCAAAHSDILHFDAKNLYFGGGRSQFEFCDLMHSKRSILYFAKIAGRSHDLSHLTEQARRTCELLFALDGGFRGKVRKTFLKHYPKVDSKWLDVRPKAGDFEFCLVSLGKNAMELPFFAKCGVSRLAKDFEERGHPISFLAV